MTTVIVVWIALAVLGVVMLATGTSEDR